MTHDRRRGLIGALALALLAMPVLSPGAAAQDPDFLFGRPNVVLGLRLGYAVPSAGSEIFDFTREQLTVEKSDFNAFSFGGELAVRATERIDAALNLGVEKSDTRSEFRDWVGDDDLPIEQDTRFTRVPVTVGAKFYLWDRGRTISRFAWVPKRVAPYVGGGAGLVWYSFEQEGEFVDFETLEIFRDDFESNGASPLVYLAGGVDVSLGPRWLVSTEARYSWASAGMDRDFVGFDDIDLAGLRGTVGLSLRF